MSDEEKRVLEYGDDRPQIIRAKLLRLMFVLIAAKIVLVAVNFFLMFSDAAAWLKYSGAGLQVMLTVAFLVVLMRITTVR